MSLEIVTVRIPTERLDAADAVVSLGGEATIPARAKMLPRPPLHHVLEAGGASHLGVPPATAEELEPGDLVACPDPYGHPAMVFEVIEHLGPWAEAFPLHDHVPDEFAGWAHLTATPARDHMTLSRYAAERGLKIAEMNHVHERARVQREVLREAAEFAEIVAKLKSVNPEPAVRALEGLRTDDGRKALLDDDGRKALLDALTRVAAEQEAPVAA